MGVYLIELKDKVLLFDIPTYSKDIEEFINKFSKPVECVLSHGSCGIADGTKWQSRIDLKVYMHESDINSHWLRMKPDFLFKIPPILDEEVEVILTPGHTPGSICLYHKPSKTIFTGDTVGGQGENIRNFIIDDRGDDTGARLKACKELLNYDFKNLLPFHYEMILETGKDALGKFLI